MDGPISSQYFTVNSSSSKGFNEGEAEWWFAFSFVGRLVAYIILLVVLVLIIALVLKFLEECDYWSSRESSEESRQPLQPKQENENGVMSTYGTCDDLECGNCSSTRGEDEALLYDGKICVICYDAPRNCFFVPCGHCATCYECAQRIMDGESKTCPVCRRFIAKVRKI